MFKTNPSEAEIAFYVDYVRSRNVTYEQLRDIIATSAATLKKQLSKDSDSQLLQILGTEIHVIKAFEEVLQRYPDKNELVYFGRRMKEDSKFTIDTLKGMLLATEEYQRMSKTQSNIAFVSLKSDVTDRQITMIIYKLYKEVTSKDYLDEDTLKFLKRKLIEYNMKEDIMKEFIKTFVTYVPGSTGASTTNSNANGGSTSSTSNESSSTPGDSSGTKEGSSDGKSTTTDTTSNTSTNNSSASSSTSADGTGKVLSICSKPNEAILSSLSSSTDTSALMDQIKSMCTTYNKGNDEYAKLAQSQTMLANYINERNKEQLGTLCSRNKTLGNADQDMVLNPELKWSVPQKHPPVCVGGSTPVNPLMSQTALIGTLLGDAKQTSVGSVLPVFPPV